MLTGTYAIEITKSITVPGLGQLMCGDVVLAGGAELGVYHPVPSAEGNPLLHIFALEAGELLNPDPQCADLAAVVGLSGPYVLGPTSAPELPPPRAPSGRPRLRRLK